MKKIIYTFCQGVYDGMDDRLQSQYSLEDLIKVFYPAFVELVIKLVTFCLGIFALILASIQWSVSIEPLLSTGCIFWLCWVVCDPTIRRAVDLLRSISLNNQKGDHF